MANKECYENNLDKESYDFLMELVENGQYSWEEIERKVDIEDNKIVWKGDLDIRGIKVKKIKAKKIEGYVNANGVESLEEIEVEEEIGGYVDIRGTNPAFTSKIEEKIKKGDLYIKGVIIS